MSQTQPLPPPWYLKVPPPIWGLAMLLAAAGLDWAANTRTIAYVPSLPLAILFSTAGIALAAWGRFLFASENTEIMPTSVSNKKLVTRGPFRFTRNPMYLGLVLLSVGIAFAFGALAYFLVPVGLFVICNNGFIPFEEAKMQRQFGEEYGAYLHRVRRWI